MIKEMEETKITSKSILLFFLLFLFLFGCVQEQGRLSEGKVREYIMRDLKEKYPDAEIVDIIEVAPSDGSFYIKAKVVYNYSTPCPIRFHIYYDYPRKGFVSSIPYYVTTQRCKVCEEGTCIIATPEEAIIASHTLTGSENVVSYLRSNPNAVPEVKYYKEFIDKDNEKHDEVWIVKWFSKNTNYGILSIISYDGKIKKSWVIIKEEKI